LKFWDSSAIVPLLLEQSDSPDMQRLFASDPALIVWWATSVECASAAARLEREGKLTDLEAEAVLGKLDALGQAWSEVLPSPTVRAVATRLLRTHPLRAADALQLAAALILAEPHARKPGFVCLDDRLAAAARKEGLSVIQSFASPA
jgi:predicted nucleic acid-binding protein